MNYETRRKILALGGENLLTEQDIAQLNASTLRVLDLMADGAWHSADEIRLAAGTDGNEASEGLRRLRELRHAFSVDRRHDLVGKCLWQYRITKKGQQELF